MNGYRENSAKTFERLIQAQYKLKPKKKHIYSATILDVDARHDEQKCYLILMVRRFCLHVCYLGLVNSSLPPSPPLRGDFPTLSVFQPGEDMCICMWQIQTFRYNLGTLSNAGHASFGETKYLANSTPGRCFDSKIKGEGQGIPGC